MSGSQPQRPLRVRIRHPGPRRRRRFKSTTIFAASLRPPERIIVPRHHRAELGPASRQTPVTARGIARIQRHVRATRLQIPNSPTTIPDHAPRRSPPAHPVRPPELISRCATRLTSHSARHRRAALSSTPARWPVGSLADPLSNSWWIQRSSDTPRRLIPRLELHSALRRPATLQRSHGPIRGALQRVGQTLQRLLHITVDPLGRDRGHDLGGQPQGVAGVFNRQGDGIVGALFHAKQDDAL